LSNTTIVDCIVAAAKDQKLKNAESAAVETIEETILLKSPTIESLHLKVSTYKGKVQISGHVHSDEELAEAVKIAHSVPGVQAVRNDLRVVSFGKYKE